MSGSNRIGLGLEEQEQNRRARGLNKAMLIGFVERRPEIRHAADGRAVAAFSVSTHRALTTSHGQERRSTEWFNVVAWGPLAEIAEQRLRERQRLYAEGHVQTRSWADLSGQRQIRTELVANRLLPLNCPAELRHPAIDAPLGMADPCLNQTMVIGSLGCDPEMRYTPGGQAVTCFNVAATWTWLGSDGKRHVATEWFNVRCLGALAELCNRHLCRGHRVYLEGELRTRTWRRADRQRHFRTELVANEMIQLGTIQQGE